jgi:anti-sigma regulatory factor (Ser/Thr protein kinase)
MFTNIDCHLHFMAARRANRPGPSLRDLALSLVAERRALSAGALAQAAGVSRQAAHRQLRRAVEEGRLVREGAGRSARYALALRRAEHVFRCEGLEEDRVLDAMNEALPELAALGPNAREIFEYALSELVDNAVAHSAGTTLRVAIAIGERGVTLEVEDDGVGVFERLRGALGLGTPREALEMLSKGRVTSDRERHRGEELFFVARAVSGFELEANGLCYAFDSERDDAAVSSIEKKPGTRARVQISRGTPRRVRDVLERHAIDHQFLKTKTSVRLFSFGARFVTRSEAKRLVAGLERFREVFIDFAGVDRVGQGFADEVFRVFAREHPETRLRAENMGPDVEYSVRRAERG